MNSDPANANPDAPVPRSRRPRPGSKSSRGSKREGEGERERERGVEIGPESAGEGCGERPALRLDGFGVAFGRRVVLGELTLSIAPRSVTVLAGPGGAGKSTLARTICGANSGVATMRVWGTAEYRGAPLGEGNWPTLVSQNFRFMTATVLENLAIALPPELRWRDPESYRRMAEERLAAHRLEDLAPLLDRSVVDLPLGRQRALAIARAALSGAELLCLDEPTADLDDEDAARIIALIRQVGRERAVLTITHHLEHARAMGGRTVLMAGGRVLGDQPTEEFFERPANAATERFARTGCAQAPPPDAAPEDLDPDAEPPPPLPAAAIEATRDARPWSGNGPSGFRWLIPNRLAGTPRPGLLVEVEEDLEALRNLGVEVLVCLTSELPPVEAELLARYGMRSLWLPMPDMAAPEPEAADALLDEVSALLDAGRVVAFHCRAGVGRTGTMLAAHLVRRGASALEALEAARRVEPKYVQSDEQARFLAEYAARRGPGRGFRETGTGRGINAGGTPI